MITRRYTWMLSLSCLLLFVVNSNLQATSVAVDTTASNWGPWVGTYPDLYLQTLTFAQIAPGDSLSQGFRTDIYQSFRVDDTFTLSEFAIMARVFDVGADFRVRIYEMADTLQAGTLPTVGATLYDQTFNTDLFTYGGPYIHRFQLTGGEPFVVSPQISPAGYVIHFQYTDVDSATALAWDGTYSNLYGDGRSFYNTENASGYDRSLALFGAEVSNVPEPSTYALALLGLAGLGLIAWKRKGFMD